MRISVFLICGALIAFTCSSTIANAETCAPLTLLNSVRMEPIQSGNAMLVPVTMNGESKRLLFDTGGSITQIAQHTVHDLGLERVMDLEVVIRDFSGGMSSWIVTIREFILGRTLGRRMVFPIAPDVNLGKGGEPYDGLLSSDLLLGYDVDVDFGADTLKFFSQDHCPGKVLYWSAPAVGVVPVTIKDKSALLVQVSMDGKNLTALVDTGASQSTMRLSAASRLFGLEKASSDPSISFRDSRMGGYIHSFSSLSFGDISVKKPHIAVVSFKSVKDEADFNGRYNPFTPEPDMILGMNVLKHLHIYLATKEHKLYVSPGSLPSRDATTKADQPQKD